MEIKGADLEWSAVAIGSGSSLGAQLEGQIIKGNPFPLCHDDSPFDGVAQFTEVARPGIGANIGEGSSENPSSRRPHSAAKCLR